MAETTLRTSPLETDSSWRLLAFAILIALFYVGEGYDLFYSAGAVWNERVATASVAAAEAGGGGSPRPIVFAALALFGAACFMLRPAGRRISMQGTLPALMLLFLILASLSVVWAETPELVLRRVISLAFFVVAAIGVSQRFSLRDAIMFVLVAGFGLAALGLAAEVALGTFRPWQPGYRFYGVMHANNIGALLAASTLAAIAMARLRPERRKLLLLVAAVGLVLLYLTKSRAALAAFLGAYWVWAFFGSQNRMRFVALSALAVALLGPVLVLAIGDKLWTGAEQAVLMGRREETLGTFTGRVPLWNHLIERYIGERPILGYGFQGFWTQSNTLRVIAHQDWVILHSHSGFVEVTLGLGLVGLVLFVLILWGAIVRSYRNFAATRDRAWLFMTVLIVWSVLSSVAEVAYFQPTIQNFICLLVLAKVGLTRLREPAAASAGIPAGAPAPHPA